MHITLFLFLLVAVSFLWIYYFISVIFIFLMFFTSSSSPFPAFLSTLSFTFLFLPIFPHFVSFHQVIFLIFFSLPSFIIHFITPPVHYPYSSFTFPVILTPTNCSVLCCFFVRSASSVGAMAVLIPPTPACTLESPPTEAGFWNTSLAPAPPWLVRKKEPVTSQMMYSRNFLTLVWLQSSYTGVTSFRRVWKQQAISHIRVFVMNALRLKEAR